MADLLMIVPSRGRPQNVRVLLEAWAETATGAADLAIVLDDDDPKRTEYGDIDQALMEAASLPFWVFMSDRRRLGGTLNHIALNFGRNYRAVGFLGDDHRPRTKAFDQRFVDTLGELGTGMAYGNDLFQGERLPTAIAMTSDIVQRLGYMVPAGLVHMYIDNAWLELGRAIGRIRYLPDVVIEHLHPSAGKGEMDASYEETNSTRQYDEDRARFEDWKRLQMPADVLALQELIRRG